MRILSRQPAWLFFVGLALACLWGKGYSQTLDDDFFDTAYSVVNDSRMISSGLFTSDTCNVDATCLPHTEKYQSAVVQISHPVLLNFCTGTVIQGPDGRIFVLSARHCVAVRRTGFVYPWSSFVLIFNYKLPCGADRVDNVTESFSSYLQGLSVVFIDEESDMVVFEVLQDIPPEWNVTLAGWDARNIKPSFPFIDFSQPFGDAQKVGTGWVYDMVDWAKFLSDGSVQEGDYGCTSQRCAMFACVLDYGILMAGSSGSGMIHQGLDRVVGTLSYGGDANCPGDNSTFNFGRLHKSWINGLYQLWPNAERSTPMEVDYSNYQAAIPTVTIGNIVPLVTPAIGPANMSIVLQQVPPNVTTVSMTVQEGKDLVRLSKDSVTFDASNWSTPVHYSIYPIAEIENSEAAKEFTILLEWPALSADGQWVQRQKTVRGALFPPIQGTSFLNPFPVKELPFTHQTSIEYYNPELPLVADEVGPFVPGIYYSLSSSVSRAMTVVACPLSGRVLDLDTPYLSIGMYESDFAYNSNDLLPQVNFDASSLGYACQGLIIAVPPNETFYLVVYPLYSFTVPGIALGLNGSVLVHAVDVGLPEFVNLVLSSNLTISIDSLPFSKVFDFDFAPDTYAFQAPLTTQIDISTCSGNTTAPTSVAIWEASELTQLAAGTSSTNYECGEIRGQSVQEGQTYLIVVAGERDSNVLLKDQRPQYRLSVSITKGAPGHDRVFDDLQVLSLKTTDPVP